MSSQLSPAEAFGILADDTRLAIVEAMVDHVFQNPREPMSFSDLRRSVGVDDAGKFNYHLGKLQPQFVEKQADGYTPQFAALAAVGAARAGTFTEFPEQRRAELDRPCPDCGDPLIGVHEGSRITIRCDEDGWMFQSIVPPRTAAERSVQEVAAYAARDTQREIEKLVDGACMVCGGPVTVETPATTELYEQPADVGILTELDCTHCAFRLQIPLGVALIRHPAVVAHHYRHGVDLREDPLFTPEFTAPEYTTVVSEDPFEAHVEVTVDGDSITLRVDGDLNAEEVE